MRSRPRTGILLVAAVSAWALLATAAEATTITIGSVLPPGSTPTEFGQVQTFFNTALPEKGANLSSPATGAIIRWRVQDAAGGPFYLRVLRPNGSGAYTAVGKSSPVTPAGPGLQTFTTNLPIHAGDLIGIDPSNAADTIGVATVAGANYGFIFPPPFDGATVAPSGTEGGKEIELSAEVQPAPAIAEVAPGHGSVKGGLSVTIAGTNLSAASAVKFGTVPATGFTVESDTQIKATVPPSKKVGPVDVSVTTQAGTSATARADRFFYRGCAVPKLRGKTLKKAKRTLTRAECKLGKVKRVNGKPGIVLKQRPRPGKVLVSKSKVNVTVGS
jgi:IPT/TIG domain-containing protein/PASTA domain-containing protein